MAISCDCGYGDYEWYYYSPADFSTLETKRGRRCISCKTLIKPGQTVGEFDCWKLPESDIEERIHGDEVPMAPKYMCEECTGLFFSITDLGYCLSLDGTPMREEAKLAGMGGHE